MQLSNRQDTAFGRCSTSGYSAKARSKKNGGKKCYGIGVRDSRLCLRCQSSIKRHRIERAMNSLIQHVDDVDAGHCAGFIIAANAARVAAGSSAVASRPAAAGCAAV